MVAAAKLIEDLSRNESGDLEELVMYLDNWPYFEIENHYIMIYRI
jgi:hypothetical protein